MSKEKRTKLYNAPFDHEAYKRDTQLIELALKLIGMMAVCALVYIIGVALMG